MLDGQTQTCNRSEVLRLKKGFLSEARSQLCEDGGSEKIPEEISQPPQKPGHQNGLFEPSEKGSKSLLVHTSKSAAALKGLIDQETFEIQWFKLNERSREYCPVELPENLIFERFKLQNAARQILQSAPYPRGPNSRWQVTFCLRCLMQMAPHVAVMLSKKFGKAHYKNLRTCGSVWTCPCCAAKISSRRADEIGIAGDVHVDAGGFLYMVTYTFSHSRQDLLVGLLGNRESRRGLLGALYRFRYSRAYKKLCASYGLVGFIRALEVTKSYANGWHPHVHELLFLTRALSESELRTFKNKLFDLWHQACFRAGLALPNRKYGVDVVRAHSPAEYLQKIGREQKWGAGAELTRSHVKRSRDCKGMTPFDLLRIADEKQDYTGYEAKSFIEYATAFFGARQCVWSRGLKQAFGIGEVSDEEIAAREDDEAQLIATIEPEMWRKVLKLPYDARPSILRLAETGGKEAVEQFLVDL